MAPMTEDELRRMLDEMYGDQKRSMLRISNGPAAENTAAADLTAGENARPMRVSPNVKDDAMSKMTAQELDEFRSQNRMKVRKMPEVRQGALALVTHAAPVAVPQAVTSTASATTPVDLVQLRRDIKEWTALHLILNNPDRHFAKGQMKTKLIAFALYYLMAALMVGIIWSAAGH
jgi:hypothetical protein